MNLKDAALEYQRKGFSVIPCRGKIPLVKWTEFQHDPAHHWAIHEWWTQWPDANIALVLGPSGVVVVDVDGPEGHRALDEAGVKIPPGTPTSMTGRGVHYFFAGNMPDRIGVLPKVDIRGQGIVVVPPSMHPSGKQYTWLEPLGDLPVFPLELWRLLQQPKAQQNDSPNWVAEALAGVTEGQRNWTCARLAGYFLGKGMPEDAVIQLLLGWADRCTPRMDTDEVIACVQSISKREGPHTDEPVSLQTKLITVADLYEQAPEEHEWIVEDYVPKGALIMLASEEKMGKSTLIYSMVTHVAQGKPFLGRQVARTPVLMLAVEEHLTDVKIRSRRFGLTPDDPVSYYVGDLPSDDNTMKELTEIVGSKGIGLVVLDTMGHHLASILEDENQSMAAIGAIKPWLRLARATNAAVVLIHHTVKGGANYRGSTAFGGIVDQLLTLRSAGGNFRDIEAKGRYWTTPKQLRVVLEGNEYRVLA